MKYRQSSTFVATGSRHKIIYIQTWANDHLSITTGILRSHSKLILHKWPLNNDHLSTSATIFGSQWWPLYTGLTVYRHWWILRTIKNYVSEKNNYVNYFLMGDFLCDTIRNFSNYFNGRLSVYNECNSVNSIGDFDKLWQLGKDKTSPIGEFSDVKTMFV